MNLKNAFLEHMDWELNFLTQVFEEKPFAGLALENEQGCPFGQWLRDEGQSRYDSLAGFQDCIDQHAALHQEAIKIAQAINEQRHEAAAAMLNLDSTFSMATLEAFSAYLRLKEQGDARLKNMLNHAPAKPGSAVNNQRTLLELMLGYIKE